MGICAQRLDDSQLTTTLLAQIPVRRPAGLPITFNKGNTRMWSTGEWVAWVLAVVAMAVAEWSWLYTLFA